MARVNEGRAAARRRALTLVSACVGLLAVVGCFRDPGAGPLCVGAECLAGSSSTGTTGTTGSTGASTEVPTGTGAPDTTGAPVDGAITLRVASMAFIDPHLFISEEAMDSDTDGTPASCVNDVTMLLNSVLNGDIEDGKFNLLLQFADFGAVNELRLVNADCELPEMPGGMRVCTPSGGSPSVNLDTEIVLEPGCREIDPDVYQAVDLPLINDPAPPCLRTKRSFFALPVSDAVGSLDLRDAQVIATLDSATSPSKLVDGVMYGFLPMAAAKTLELDAPLFGVVDLWSIIEVPACDATYPALLPSVDMFEINDVAVPGAWIAINFTAEQVEYRPPG